MNTKWILRTEEKLWNDSQPKYPPEVNSARTIIQSLRVQSTFSSKKSVDDLIYTKHNKENSFYDIGNRIL